MRVFLRLGDVLAARLPPPQCLHSMGVSVVGAWAPVSQVGSGARKPSWHMSRRLGEKSKDRIDLKLIGFLFFLTQASVVGGFADKALHFQEQCTDFLKAAFGDVHHLVSTFSIVNGCVD